MQQVLKESILYIVIVVAVFIAGLYFTIPMFPQVSDSYDALKSAERKLEETQRKLEAAKTRVPVKVEVIAEGGKRIFVAEDMSFSPQASFAPLFETVINTARAAGIRFRSIEYNYEPGDDEIFKAKIPGYNICELVIDAAGTYTQFQRFFKGLIQGDYLKNIAEIEMYPYDIDRSILIAKLKIRLYTRTGPL